jgi:hypothetical protein
MTFGDTFTWWEQIVVWMQSFMDTIVKGIEILIFKSVGKVYDFVKYMVGRMVCHNSYT